MNTLYLCTVALVMASFVVIDTQDLVDKRLYTIRRVTRNIQRQLVGIEHRDYECNGTVYDVMEKMDDVSKQVEDLYKGPFLAKIDLADGQTVCDRVFLKVADPVEDCLSSFEKTRVSPKDARMRCIQQRAVSGNGVVFFLSVHRLNGFKYNVLWRLQLPEGISRKSERIMAKYNSYVNRLKARAFLGGNKPPGSKEDIHRTTVEGLQTTNAYMRRHLLMFASTSTSMSTTSSPLLPITTVNSLRVRKEYRTLTLTERTRFHNALNVLYQDGTIAAFAETHRRATRGAHRGPAFLPWHRVFITRFEDALQRVDPSVTLPYWDSTMDDCMPNPATSTMWSDEFLGNGAGVVVTGPCAGWTAGDWFLERSYAQRGGLVRRVNVNRALTRCRFSQITVPTGRRRFRIESFHNGVHIWVGGDMNSVRSAPYDPVFYLHHCFIDYIWEKFRQRQIFCGLNPETDYIQASGRHNYNSRMAQQRDYRVRDGLSFFWTDEVFRYADPPTCQNNCGDSEHLYCDTILNCCVPFSRFGNNVTTTTTMSTSGPFRRRRRSIDMGNDTDGDSMLESDGTCDKYLDPDCNNKLAFEYDQRKRQIPLKLEKEIIEKMVVKNKGEPFTPDSSDTTRTLDTVEQDEQNYDVFRANLLEEEALAAKEEL